MTTEQATATMNRLLTPSLIMYVLIVVTYNQYGHLKEYRSLLTGLYYLSNSLIIFLIIRFLKSLKNHYKYIKGYKPLEILLGSVMWYNIALSVFNLACILSKSAEKLVNSIFLSGLSTIIIFVLLILYNYGRLDKK